jgi:hypothetical protein
MIIASGLQQEAHAHRGDQRRQAGRVAQRPIGYFSIAKLSTEQTTIAAISETSSKAQPGIVPLSLLTTVQLVSAPPSTRRHARS